MATRYCGTLTIRIHCMEERAPAHPRGASPAYYRVYIQSPVAKSTPCALPEPVTGGYPERAVDSPEAYDVVARAALDSLDPEEDYPPYYPGRVVRCGVKRNGEWLPRREG